MFDLAANMEVPSVVREIKLLDNRGVHNFSYHILDCYFKLHAQLAKRSVRFLTPSIVELSKLPGKNSTKVFVYSAKEGDVSLLKKAQENAVIYSIDPLPLEKGGKFKELCYDFNEVFNPENYPSAKKRHQRIKYPFTWVEREGYRLEVLRGKEPSIAALHDEWVQRKIDDPKTFKMMFPGKRYLNCVERAACDANSYRIFGVYADMLLVAVRVIGMGGGNAYDMAFFGRFWDLPSQAMNYFNIWILKELYEEGVQHFNCGCFLNKSLHQFKAHYPHHELTSFAYSKLSNNEV